MKLGKLLTEHAARLVGPDSNGWTHHAILRFGALFGGFHVVTQVTTNAKGSDQLRIATVKEDGNRIVFSGYANSLSFRLDDIAMAIAELGELATAVKYAEAFLKDNGAEGVDWSAIGTWADVTKEPMVDDLRSTMANVVALTGVTAEVPQASDSLADELTALMARIEAAKAAEVVAKPALTVGDTDAFQAVVDGLGAKGCRAIRVQAVAAAMGAPFGVAPSKAWAMVKKMAGK